MIDDFHKDAAKNFSDEGKTLAESLSPIKLSSSTSFSGPSFHSVTTWNRDDISDFSPQSQKDVAGREVARYGVVNEITIGFEGQSYLNFAKLVEKIHKTKPLKDLVSFETLSELCFIWMTRHKYRNESVSLSEFVLRKSRELIETHSIAIPIYELRLESPKRLGRVELRPISSADIDRWCSDILSAWPEIKQQLQAEEAKWRKNYQGRAAAFIEIKAEQKMAEEIALHEVEKSLAALRLFSTGTVHPQAQSNCVPWGHEHSRRNVSFSFQGDIFSAASEAISLDGGFSPWDLTDRDFDDFWKSGLKNLHDLIRKSSPSSFEKDLLKVMMIYSRVSLSSDQANKLIYLFVALETILLKDSSESISSNISKRAAYIIGETVDECLEIEANIKEAYKLRSKFFHHGAEIGQFTTIETFMHHIFAFFLEILHHRSKFEKRQNLIDYLENSLKRNQYRRGKQ